jgi:hypothetical protein
MIYDGQVDVICEQCQDADHLQLDKNYPLNTGIQTLAEYVEGQMRIIGWQFAANGAPICPTCVKKKGTPK